MNIFFWMLNVQQLIKLTFKKRELSFIIYIINTIVIIVHEAQLTFPIHMQAIQISPQ